MNLLLTLSDFLIPVTVLFIVVFGCLQKVNIYEVFLEGAKEGLQTVMDILPTLIGLIMADLNGRLKDKSISVVLDEAAKEFVVERAYDPMYGARPLKRFVQTHVETLVAKKILADEVREGDVITITVVGDRLVVC